MSTTDLGTFVGTPATMVARPTIDVRPLATEAV
jgi:hypothetical protein